MCGAPEAAIMTSGRGFKRTIWGIGAPAPTTQGGGGAAQHTDPLAPAIGCHIITRYNMSCHRAVTRWSNQTQKIAVCRFTHGAQFNMTGLRQVGVNSAAPERSC